MDEIAEPWDDADDIMAYTDTDLQYSRLWNTAIYDRDSYVRWLADGVTDAYDFDGYSETCDFALRIGLAHLIDTMEGEPVVTREEYDIAYMIPPQGWVTETSHREVSLADVRPETTERYGQIRFSAPETTKAMIQVLMDAGVVESYKAVVVHGLELLTDHSE